MNVNNLLNLLNQVTLIGKKNNEILDATGRRFNMFRMCGVNHYENTHSAILAEFLNPFGSHGLKECFLRLFLEEIKEQIEINNFCCENANVRTEVVCSDEDGRMDILIEDQYKNAFIIENKIYAQDQSKQLKRYAHYASQKYGKGKYQILYLTLDGKKASEQSGQDVSYIQISYAETIINWMEKCVCLAVHYPFVRETINQYINHLKQLTNQDMDAKNSKEIVELMIKPENIEAVMTVLNNQDALNKAILKKYFEPEMKRIAGELGLEFEVEDSLYDGNPGAFYFLKSEWKLKILFGNEMRNWKDFYWGLCVVDEDKPYPQEKQRLLSTLFNLGPDEKNPYGWAYLSQYQSWDRATFTDIINGIFAEEIKGYIENLLNIIGPELAIDVLE